MNDSNLQEQYALLEEEKKENNKKNYYNYYLMYFNYFSNNFRNSIFIIWTQENMYNKL